MRKLQYSILADIQDAIERAKQGKLALFWQRTIQREYRCKKVTPAEQQAYEQLQSILSETPQWSDEEELRSGMEKIDGRVWFCYFWIDHNSMVQLTEDRNGRFHVAYVLDRDASPAVRRKAALLAQKELADCIGGCRRVYVFLYKKGRCRLWVRGCSVLLASEGEWSVRLDGS